MRNYIPKRLQILKKEELEPCPQNEILFDKLLLCIKVNEGLKHALEGSKDTKEIISLSNTINGNIKSIIAIMNTFIYIEEQPVGIDDILGSM